MTLSKEEEEVCRVNEDWEPAFFLMGRCANPSLLVEPHQEEVPLHEEVRLP